MSHLTSARHGAGLSGFGVNALRVIAVLLGLLAVVVTPVEAQDAGDDQDPSTATVHRVDARGDEVEASVLLDDYNVNASDVTVREHGQDLEVSSVKLASEADREVEVVFVVDTDRHLAKGDVFPKMTAAMASAIKKLPSGTTVSVVAAGKSATVKVAPTTDLEKAAAVVQGLDLSEGSSVFNAIDRAGALIDGEREGLSTVVVFSGSEDTMSEVSARQAGVPLIQDATQLVAVLYLGGESELNQLVDETSGASIETATPAEVAPAVAEATAMAGDRLLVTYDGATDPSVRGDDEMTIGSAYTAYSYQGGVVADRAAALTAIEDPEPSGIAFFRSKTGLYIAVLLAFVGIGLGIYALGALFASGESSLEGLLDRYSGEGDGVDLADDEQALVQTALVKRAVELSESFAEEQGFLGKVEDLLERARLPLRPGEAMSFYVAAVFLASCLGYVLFGGPIGMVILGTVVAVGLLFAVRFKAVRRIKAFERQLPDTLQLLAGTLRAGYSLPQGLEAVSNEITDPMGHELRRAMTEARLGREIEDALGATAERLSSPDFAWDVMAISIQREVGGNLNELLMTVSDTMIARERLKGEVAALTAEGKMSAAILGGLPPCLGLAMYVMNPGYIGALFSEPLGWAMLAGAGVLMTIGLLWMKKVITINV